MKLEVDYLMNNKEKLIKLKNKLISLYLLINKNYEFDAPLEEHLVGKQNIYRLYYVNYHRIGENYCKSSNIGMIDWPCKPFMLPNNMTREEGFKILSYLTDFIEKRDDIDYGSLSSVRMLDDVLDLERFGFTRVEEQDEDKILNLFTIDGRVGLFRKHKLYPQYFEWYTSNVTLEEVKNIYLKYDMDFHDIVWLDIPDVKEQYKKIKKIEL